MSTHPLSGAPVVVTGATGHLGANLLPPLLASGARVRALVRHRPLRIPCEAVAGDLHDPESLAQAFRGAQIVFHLAARISIAGDPTGEVHATNVDGARHVAWAARKAGVRRLVHVSSIHAFAHPPEGPMDETAARPGPDHPAYDRSKAAGEQAVREAAGDALEVVIANPTGVIGPADDAPSRTGQMFLHWYHRTLPALIPGGFDWVDARDVADALIAMATHGRPDTNYFLGGGWRSLADLARIASEVTGVRPPRWLVPLWMAYGSAPLVSRVQGFLGQEPLFTRDALEATTHGCRDIRCDRAKRDLDYRTRSHEDSVRDIYTSFREAAMLKGGPWSSR